MKKSNIHLKSPGTLHEIFRLYITVGNTFEIFSWQHRWHDTLSKFKQTSKKSKLTVSNFI
jgi:hypothetical protein